MSLESPVDLLPLALNGNDTGFKILCNTLIGINLSLCLVDLHEDVKNLTWNAGFFIIICCLDWALTWNVSAELSLGWALEKDRTVELYIYI